MEIQDTGLFFEGVKCPHCGAEIIPGFNRNEDGFEDFGMPPCEHVYLMANDAGITYLSQKVREQLETAGFRVDGANGELIEVEDVSKSESLDLGSIGRILDRPTAQILATYAPAPSFDGIYVGLSL